jgi:hypothetical protein
MKREQVYTAVGAGVGIVLVGAMLWALDSAARSAPAPQAQGGGTGQNPPRDPWAATRTQLSLLQVARNNFSALAASALPSGKAILQAADDLVATVNQQFFATVTLPVQPRDPPVPSFAIVAYSSYLTTLDTNVATISTWDATTAQTAAIVSAQAHAVLATALAAVPPPGSNPQGNV